MRKSKLVLLVVVSLVALVAAAVQVDVIAPQNELNTTNSSLDFLVNVTGNQTTFNCSLLLNGVFNQSNESVQNATIANFSLVNISVGNYSWQVNCSDVQNVTNISEVRVFNITAPVFNVLAEEQINFTNITFEPRVDDHLSLDPNVPINVSVNVSSNGTIGTVVLNVNITPANTVVVQQVMTFNATTGLYGGSFNVTQESNYSVYITANTTLATNASSNVTNLTIFFERNWTRTPEIIAPVSMELNQNLQVGSINITNHADFDFHVLLVPSLDFMDFDDTSVSLGPNEQTEDPIGVYAFSGLNAGSFPYVITYNADEPVNVTPVKLNTTGLLVIAPTDAFVFISFTQFPSQILQGGTAVIQAQVKNIGVKNATNVTANITLPSDWTLLLGNLSTNFSVIVPNQSVLINLTVQAGQTVGDRLLIGNVTGFNTTGDSLKQKNATFDEQRTMTVVAPFVSGGGSGGASSSSSAAASASSAGSPSVAAPYTPKPLVPTLKEAFIETEETIEIVRGQTDVIPFIVRNVFEGMVLDDVWLNIEGFNAKYVSYGPQELDNIAFGNTGTFTITLEPPAYSEDGMFELTVTVTGIAQGIERYQLGGEYKEAFVQKPFREVRHVKVYVLAMSTQDALFVQDEAQKFVGLLESLGISSKTLESLIGELTQAVRAKEHEKVMVLNQRIVDLKEFILDAYAKMSLVKERIERAKKQGLDVAETKRLLVLAQSAFEREEYALAAQRADDALLVELIETRGAFNVVNFIARFWWAILLSLAVALFAGLLIFRIIERQWISRRIAFLSAQFRQFSQLERSAQEDCFVAHKISVPTYHKLMYSYSLNKERIHSQISRLRTRRVVLLGKDKELELLRKEQEVVRDVMRQVQSAYYERALMSRRKYLSSMDELKARLAEIERTIFAVEVQNKRQSRWQKVTDKMAGLLGRIDKGSVREDALRLEDAGFKVKALKELRVEQGVPSKVQEGVPKTQNFTPKQRIEQKKNYKQQALGKVKNG